MILSLLQLNINADNFWDRLISYVTTHDFDILQFQEVCGENTFSGNIQCKRDCFTELQKILAEKYNGELAITQRYTSNPTSYMGNATFYKNTFQLIEKNVVTLFDRATPFPSKIVNFEEAGRNMLHLKLSKDDKVMSVVNTHFTWAKTPKEEPHQAQQGKIVLNYMKTLPSPFILSGDFNLADDQPIIKKLNTLARNLTTENNVRNTLNPRTHYIKHLLANGLEIAVDYIFASQDILVKDFAVIEEDISDHFALTTELII